MNKTDASPASGGTCYPLYKCLQNYRASGGVSEPDGAVFTTPECGEHGFYLYCSKARKEAMEDHLSEAVDLLENLQELLREAVPLAEAAPYTGMGGI